VQEQMLGDMGTWTVIW